MLTAEHAYGSRDGGLVHPMPLADFTEPPEPGQIIAFALPNGEQTPGTVISVDGETVEVDFNHPLAGRNLVFRVEILEVQNSGSKTP
jgi:FKBP-type peptidyl-prolyl cis-trans isomerase SlpA